MATITVYKCDFCGRMWKPGKNDKAVEIVLTINPQDAERFREGKAAGLFCCPQHAEMAIAAALLNWQPKKRKPGETRKDKHGVVRWHPLGGIIGLDQIVDDVDEDDDD